MARQLAPDAIKARHRLLLTLLLLELHRDAGICLEWQRFGRIMKPLSKSMAG